MTILHIQTYSLLFIFCIHFTSNNNENALKIKCCYNLSFYLQALSIKIKWFWIDFFVDILPIRESQRIYWISMVIKGKTELIYKVLKGTHWVLSLICRICIFYRFTRFALFYKFFNTLLLGYFSVALCSHYFCNFQKKRS